VKETNDCTSCHYYKAYTGADPTVIMVCSHRVMKEHSDKGRGVYYGTSPCKYYIPPMPELDRILFEEYYEKAG